MRSEGDPTVLLFDEMVKAYPDVFNARLYPPPVFNGGDNSMEVVERKAITMLHIIPVNKNIVNVISDYIRYGKKQDLIAYTKKLELQRGLERLKAASSKVDN